MVFPPFLLIFCSGEHLQIPSHGPQQEFYLMNEQNQNLNKHTGFVSVHTIIKIKTKLAQSKNFLRKLLFHHTEQT